MTHSAVDAVSVATSGFRAGAVTLAALVALLCGSLPSVAGESAKDAMQDKTGGTRKDASEESRQSEGEAKKRLRAALEQYDRATSSQEMSSALTDIRANVKQVRSELVDALGSQSARVRSIAVQLLCEGELGELEIMVLRKGLQDSVATVRMTALRAARRLDERGRGILLEYCARETEARNRVVALDIISRRWKEAAFVPPLYSILENERDEKARRACIRALERVSGQKYGDDMEAWSVLAQKQQLTDQARKLIEAMESGSKK